MDWGVTSCIDVETERRDGEMERFFGRLVLMWELNGETGRGGDFW
ncbi:MAG: hypothetical protein AB8B69_24780 [Chitinophagales bacterium]